MDSEMPTNSGGGESDVVVDVETGAELEVVPAEMVVETAVVIAPPLPLVSSPVTTATTTTATAKKTLKRPRPSSSSGPGTTDAVRQSPRKKVKFAGGPHGTEVTVDGGNDALELVETETETAANGKGKGGRGKAKGKGKEKATTAEATSSTGEETAIPRVKRKYTRRATVQKDPHPSPVKTEGDEGTEVTADGETDATNGPVGKGNGKGKGKAKGKGKEKEKEQEHVTGMEGMEMDVDAAATSEANPTTAVEESKPKVKRPYTRRTTIQKDPRPPPAPAPPKCSWTCVEPAPTESSKTEKKLKDGMRPRQWCSSKPELLAALPEFVVASNTFSSTPAAAFAAVSTPTSASVSGTSTPTPTPIAGPSSLYGPSSSSKPTAKLTPSKTTKTTPSKSKAASKATPKATPSKTTSSASQTKAQAGPCVKGIAWERYACPVLLLEPGCGMGVRVFRGAGGGAGGSENEEDVEREGEGEDEVLEITMTADFVCARNALDRLGSSKTTDTPISSGSGVGGAGDRESPPDCQRDSSSGSAEMHASMDGAAVASTSTSAAVISSNAASSLNGMGAGAGGGHSTLVPTSTPEASLPHVPHVPPPHFPPPPPFVGPSSTGFITPQRPQTLQVSQTHYMGQLQVGMPESRDSADMVGVQGPVSDTIMGGNGISETRELEMMSSGADVTLRPDRGGGVIDAELGGADAGRTHLPRVPEAGASVGPTDAPVRPLVIPNTILPRPSTAGLSKQLRLPKFTKERMQPAATARASPATENSFAIAVPPKPGKSLATLLTNSPWREPGALEFFTSVHPFDLLEQGLDSTLKNARALDEGLDVGMKLRHIPSLPWQREVKEARERGDDESLIPSLPPAMSNSQAIDAVLNHYIDPSAPPSDSEAFPDIEFGSAANPALTFTAPSFSANSNLNLAIPRVSSGGTKHLWVENQNEDVVMQDTNVEPDPSGHRDVVDVEMHSVEHGEAPDHSLEPPVPPSIPSPKYTMVEDDSSDDDEVPLDQRVPSSIPPEIADLIDRYILGTPVLVIASRASFAQAWAIDLESLPEEFEYGVLGFFEILGVKEERVTRIHDVDTRTQKKRNGMLEIDGVRGRMWWRFRLRWGAGGEDILTDDDAPTFPWWKSGKSRETFVPNSVSSACADTPITTPAMAPTTSVSDTFTTPRHLASHRANHNYQFRDVPLRMKCPSVLPLRLLLDEGEGYYEGVLAGWFCQRCGKINMQLMLRHRACGSSFCKDRPHPRGYALLLEQIRDPQERLPMILPMNAVPPGVRVSTKAWKNEMLVLSYIVKEPWAAPVVGTRDGFNSSAPISVFVKHVFTCNATSLQVEATELLRDVQLEVELSKAVGDSSPLFFSSTGASAIPWDSSPTPMLKARDILSKFCREYGEHPEPTFTFNRLDVIGWMSVGSTRSTVKTRQFFSAKTNWVAIMCLGHEVTLTFVPKTGFAVIPSSTKAITVEDSVRSKPDLNSLIAMDVDDVGGASAAATTSAASTHAGLVADTDPTSASATQSTAKRRGRPKKASAQSGAGDLLGGGFRIAPAATAKSILSEVVAKAEAIEKASLLEPEPLSVASVPAKRMTRARARDGAGLHTSPFALSTLEPLSTITIDEDQLPSEKLTVASAGVNRSGSMIGRESPVMVVKSASAPVKSGSMEGKDGSIGRMTRAQSNAHAKEKAKGKAQSDAQELPSNSYPILGVSDVDPGGEDADASEIVNEDGSELENESDLMPLEVSSGVGKAVKPKGGPSPTKATSRTVRSTLVMTMVHGDTVILSGDDYEYSIKRLGTSILLVGSTV